MAKKKPDFKENFGTGMWPVGRVWVKPMASLHRLKTKMSNSKWSRKCCLPISKKLECERTDNSFGKGGILGSEE